MNSLITHSLIATTRSPSHSAMAMAIANTTIQDVVDENQSTASTTTCTQDETEENQVTLKANTQDAIEESRPTANTTIQNASDENQPIAEQAKHTTKGPVTVELSEIPSNSGKSIPLSASWTPVFLHIGFFVCCAILFICMIIALEVLYWLSERDHGLVSSSQDRHDFWKYVPVAGTVFINDCRMRGFVDYVLVFTIFSTLLAQTEYRSKELAPWRNMARQWSSAKESLLLNYLSPLKLVTLRRALKDSHYTVVFSVSVSLLLQVLTIMSAGLFGLSFQPVEISSAITTLDEFNVSSLNTGGSGSSAPASLVLWSHILDGVPYPYGTTEKYATQSLAAPYSSECPKSPMRLCPLLRHSDLGYRGTIHAPAIVFASDLECAPMSWDYVDSARPYMNQSGSIIINANASRPVSNVPSLYFALNMWTPDCFIENYAFEVAWDVTEDPVWHGNFPILNCTNVTEVGRSRGFDAREQLVISTSWATTNLSTQAPGKVPARTILNISGVICNPTYSYSRRIVTAQVGGTVDSVTIPDQILDHVEFPRERYLLDCLSEWIKFHVTRPQETHATYNASMKIRKSAWHMLMNATAPQQALRAFDNTTLVTDLSRQLFKALSAQVAKRMLARSSNATVEGTVIITDSRLRLLALPLRLLEVGLGLLTVAILALARIWVPRHRVGVVPRDMSSVGALALVLARSKRLREMLVGAGNLRNKELTKRIEGCEFKTLWTENPTGTFRIEVVRPDDNEEALERETSHGSEGSTDITSGQSVCSQVQTKSWKPIAARRLFRGMCLVCPLLLVALLETTMQKSKKNNGLVDIESGSYVQLAWVYLPASVMSAVGASFDSLDWVTRTLYPYHKLSKRETSRGGYSPWWNPFGRVTLHGAIEAALNKRAAAVLATMTATLFAPLLTIVVSGLYMPELVLLSYPVPVVQRDWFDADRASTRPTVKRGQFTSYVDSNLDASLDTHPKDLVDIFEPPRYWSSPAEIAGSRVLYQNRSDPRWTHGALVMPAIELAPGVQGHSSNSTLEISLPAVRARMNCSVVDYRAQGPYKFDVEVEPHVFLSQIHVSIPAPMPCRSSVNNFSSIIDLATNFSTIIGQGAINNGSIRLPGEPAGFYARRAAHLVNGESFMSPENCGVEDNEHMLFMVWNQTLNATKDLSVVYCEPYVQAVSIEAKFNATSLELVPNPPPRVDEQSARYFSKIPKTLALPRLTNGIVSLHVSDFFVVMFGGKDAPLRHDVVGADKAQNLVQQMDKTYGRMLLHVLNLNFRNNNSNSPTSVQVLLQGNLTDPSRSRLVQNAVSTRILQGLLSVLAIAAAIMCVALPTTCFLPNDPSSILARASLLADNRLLDHIPEGADMMTNAELEKRKVFKELRIAGLGGNDGGNIKA